MPLQEVIHMVLQEIFYISYVATIFNVLLKKAQFPLSNNTLIGLGYNIAG